MGSLEQNVAPTAVGNHMQDKLYVRIWAPDTTRWLMSRLDDVSSFVSGIDFLQRHIHEYGVALSVRSGNNRELCLQQYKKIQDISHVRAQQNPVSWSDFLDFPNILSLRTDFNCYYMDFSKLSNVHTLWGAWPRKYENLSSLSKLSDLAIEKGFGGKSDGLDELSCLDSLETLYIRSSKLKTLKGIGNLHKLRELKLWCPSLVDLSDLSNTNVETIYLYNTNSADFTTLTKASRLRRLLVDGVQFNDIKFLTQMPQLEYVSMTTSNIKSNDLDSLRILAENNLTYAAVAPSKRSYVPTSEEIGRAAEAALRACTRTPTWKIEQDNFVADCKKYNQIAESITQQIQNELRSE